MKKPNIVYLHAHDLGRFCEPMGYAIPAPNLMRFAQQGVLFRQCHSSAPTCAPSRAALLTGQHPHRCGMLGLPTEALQYRLNDYDHHLAAFLRGQGYETALSGHQHEARAPSSPTKECLPYDHFLNYLDTGKDGAFDRGSIVTSAGDYLMQDHEKPFFLSIGIFEPHRANGGDRRTFIGSVPVEEPADIDERARYCQPWPHMPDNEITRREMANFKMGVETMDGDIGRILKVLDSPKLRENTLVIFTTDHGPGVCEMKATLKDHGTGVFMIWRGPTGAEYGEAGTFKGGQVFDTMTQHLDVFPTLAELVGAQPEQDLDGTSLMPLVNKQTSTLHEVLFTEQTYHADLNPRPLRAMRTDRYKYIRSYKADQPRGVDRDAVQAFWEEYGYAEMPTPDEQLYDLIFDPNEMNNLAGSDDHAEVLEEMRQRLQTWQQETEDPLLNGEIPVPPAQQALSV